MIRPWEIDHLTVDQFDRCCRTADQRAGPPMVVLLESDDDD